MSVRAPRDVLSCLKYAQANIHEDAIGPLNELLAKLNAKHFPVSTLDHWLTDNICGRATISPFLVCFPLSVSQTILLLIRLYLESRQICAQAAMIVSHDQNLVRELRVQDLFQQRQSFG